MTEYRHKVKYKWFNRANGKLMTMTAFMTQEELSKLLVCPEIRLISVNAKLQSSRTKSSKYIEK